MSSISGLSALSYSATQTPSVRRGGGADSSQTSRPSGVDPEQRLEQALADAGVDAETAESIKTELRAVIEQGLASGDSAPGESVKEEVDSIFEEHGLNASDFLGRPGLQGPGGPPPGGPPPASGAEGASSEEDSSEESNLLSLIESLAEQESDPTKLAELIVDALYGLDEFV